MLQTLIIGLAAVALLGTGLAAYTNVVELTMLFGVGAMFAGGLATYGLFNIEVVSNGAVVAVGAEPALALFTVTVTAVAGYVTFVAPVDLVGEAMDDTEPFGKGGL
jgi:hypothetical protein